MTPNTPRPYMLGKAQIGHYRIAFETSLKVFKQQDPQEMAARSGTNYDPEQNVFTVPSFGQNITVHYPSGHITFQNTDLLPLTGWRLIILNHLSRADGVPLTGQLISYRELENGLVYFPAFRREHILPLGRWLDHISMPDLNQAGHNLKGTPGTGADFAVVLYAMPKFPVTIKIWLPDDELPGSANILFDATADHYLHVEDVAVAGGYAASFLMNEYQMLIGKPWHQITL